jgi:hypothetical protein
MTHLNEIETFRAAWNAEAQDTLRLLEALPPDQYDFAPTRRAARSGRWPGT